MYAFQANFCEIEKGFSFQVIIYPIDLLHQFQLLQILSGRLEKLVKSLFSLLHLQKDIGSLLFISGKRHFDQHQHILISSGFL